MIRKTFVITAVGASLFTQAALAQNEPSTTGRRLQ
jgi:hypothetical protein